MGAIEAERTDEIQETCTKREAVINLLRARSDGIAGGGGSIGTVIFVASQSQDNPLLDQVINSGTAGVVVGAVISITLCLARSGGRTMHEAMAQRNEAAKHALGNLKRRDIDKRSM